ncbi:MAG: hypothetical protein KAR83_01605, partial [Thermodesulfovibrionales bacterium]|nr:hypothetical protein [Thermodesulfovibrionales bacterium]
RVHTYGKEVRLRGGELTPENVADDIMGEFHYQRDMINSAMTSVMKVRYEDFCTDPAIFEKIKGFTESAIPGIGEFESGTLNPKIKAVHNGTVSNKSVRRWMNEEEGKILKDAQKVFDLMPEYSEFWGYDREEGVLQGR